MYKNLHYEQLGLLQTCKSGSVSNIIQYNVSHLHGKEEKPHDISISAKKKSFDQIQ